jgi:hypothetical protein
VVAAVKASVLRAQWIRLIFAVHAALEADERGADLVERWSATTDKAGQYEDGEAHGTYSVAVLPWRAKPGLPPLVDKGTLFAMAGERGWKWDSADRAESALQAAIAAATEPAAETTPPVADDAAFPLHLIAGNDLLSEIVRDMVATATVPQPALALGTAIAAFGAVLGRRVQAIGNGGPPTRTNVYVLAVGGTSSGKNWPRTRCADVLARAGMHDRIGPREYMSGSGVYATLLTCPAHVAFIDEFGMVLQAMQGQNAPPHLRSIVTALLMLYSSAATTVAGAGYANQRENPSRPIVEPCLSLVGFTTPSTLVAALSSKNIADGLLGRILLFVADDKAKKRRGMFRANGEQRTNGDHLVARLVEFVKATAPGDLPDVGGPAESRCRSLTWSDAAAEYFDDVLLPLEDDRRHGRLGGVWARLIEHVSRVALIHAVACDPTATVITIESVRWAHELVAWCLGRMHQLVSEHIADTQVEADSQRILQIVRDAGPAGISATTLTRRTQWLTRSARKEMITSLVEGEQLLATPIEANRADGKGKPKTIYTLPVTA